MLPVLGKPMVERVMELLREGGVDEFIVVVNPEDKALIKHLTQENPFRESTRLAFQEKPLGMADALKSAASLIQDDFLLAACDSIVAPELIRKLIEAKREHGVTGVLSLQKVPRSQLARLGAVAMEGPWVVRVVEKPKPEEAPSDIATLPIYVFSPDILEYLDQVPLSPRGEYEIQDAIQMLIDRRGGVQGVFTDWRIDLTQPRDLLTINLHFMKRGCDLRMPAPSQLGSGSSVIPPVRIEENVEIGDACLIGPYVYLENGARLGNGVLIRRAVVLRGTEISDGEEVYEEVRYPSVGG